MKRARTLNMLIDMEKSKKLWPETCHGRWMDPECEEGLVSVIIPTYNRAHLITDAMDSVWKQTYRPIELIVVDDGSTDNTQEMVEKWREKYKKDNQFQLRCFRQDNKGAPAARNRGLLKSTGEFIQFLDSDDILSARKLENEVGVLQENEEVNFIFSEWKVIEISSGNTIKDWPSDFSPDWNDILDRMLGEGEGCKPLWTANTLYRRSLCNRIGPWDTSRIRMQDRRYNMKVLLSGAVYLHVPKKGTFARAHPGERIDDTFDDPQSIKNMWCTWSEISNWLDHLGLMNRKRRSLQAEFYYQLARPAFIAEKEELGRALLRKATALCTCSIKCFRIWLARGLYRILGMNSTNRLLNQFRRFREKLGLSKLV